MLNEKWKIVIMKTNHENKLESYRNKEFQFFQNFQYQLLLKKASHRTYPCKILIIIEKFQTVYLTHPDLIDKSWIWSNGEFTSTTIINRANESPRTIQGIDLKILSFRKLFQRITNVPAWMRDEYNFNNLKIK